MLNRIFARISQVFGARMPSMSNNPMKPSQRGRFGSGTGKKTARRFRRQKENSTMYRIKRWNATSGSIGPHTIVYRKRRG